MMYNQQEKQYLDLCAEILKKKTRTGRNGKVKSIFNPTPLRFDLRNEQFPLLTTKKMFFKGIVEELLFFIRGDTDARLLEEKGVCIWKGNTSREFLDKNGFSDREEGIMGPMYGFQWRHFDGTYDEKTGKGSGGVDQLAELLDGLRSDPFSRRHLLTDYNPRMAKSGVLYPCHSIVMQFYVDADNADDSCHYLDAFCYNRSSDVFLGLPFNIASSALLLRLIADAVGFTPRYLTIALGDAHVYECHIDAVREQLTREPFAFPKLVVAQQTQSVKDMERLQFADFQLHEYLSHASIWANMVA